MVYISEFDIFGDGLTIEAQKDAEKEAVIAEKDKEIERLMSMLNQK